MIKNKAKNYQIKLNKLKMIQNLNYQKLIPHKEKKKNNI